MKKLVIIFMMLSLYGVTSSFAEGKESVETLDWACCTVSTSDSEVTVCRADGNTRKACREARALL